MPSKTEPVGKGGKNAPHARERARLLKVQREQREARRRLLIRVGVPLLVVATVIAVMVVVRILREPEAAPVAASGSADAAITQALTSIPEATFDAVGIGSVRAAPTAITGPPLTADGKPRVLYVGAEYCPYCAAERWPVTVALSRFGTFTDLGQTTSASADVFPSTATLSFHGSTYTSDLLSFTGVETTSNVRAGNGYAPLDTLTADDQALVTQYNSTGSIPFMDVGNAFVFSGASFDPGVLAGLDQEQIAAALADPTSPVAQAVNGTANVITAALCTRTGNEPADVCTSAGVQAGAAKLPA